jgi:hypothetical protein
VGFPVIEVVQIGMKLLRELGLTKDPEAEKEYRLRVLEWAARRDVADSEEFVAFVRATTPDAQYTPRFVNALQAVTRPAITWIVMGAIVAAFFDPSIADNIGKVLNAFSEAGTAGLLLLAIPGWWFFGRSMERIVPGMAAVRGMGQDADAETGAEPFWRRGQRGAESAPQEPRRPAPVTRKQDPQADPDAQPPADDWPRSEEQFFPERGAGGEQR